jgi:hypothetical protein
MQTLTLTVDADGRVTIPGTQPGEIVTVQVPLEHPKGPIPEKNWDEIRERVMRLAGEIREKLPEPWKSADHGDLLYGEDGLPK